MHQSCRSRWPEDWDDRMTVHWFTWFRPPLIQSRHGSCSELHRWGHLLPTHPFWMDSYLLLNGSTPWNPDWEKKSLRMLCYSSDVVFSGCSSMKILAQYFSNNNAAFSPRGSRFVSNCVPHHLNGGTKNVWIHDGAKLIDYCIISGVFVATTQACSQGHGSHMFEDTADQPPKHHQAGWWWKTTWSLCGFGGAGCPPNCTLAKSRAARGPASINFKSAQPCRGLSGSHTLLK